MLRPWKCREFLLALPLVLLVSVSCGSDQPTQPQAGPPTAYVNAATGDDANSGGSGSPFRTITYALSHAASGSVVQVAPGMYDAVGEVFPIVVPSGVTLRGDTAQRGGGSTPTSIEGTGTVPNTAVSAALVAKGNATITGFTIANGTGTGANIGIYTDEQDVEISANTFALSARGVQVDVNGTAIVRGCTFATPLYGVLTLGQATVQFNAFTSGSYGVDTQGGQTVIRRNTFSARGDIGVFLQAGTASILDNVFSSAGYTSAAVLSRFATAPLLRGNTFTLPTGPAVRIQETSMPDLGTVQSPGGNTFDLTSGADVHHVSSDTISAIGNTWSHTPPLCGSTITGSGTITWGPGLDQNCPGPPPPTPSAP